MARFHKHKEALSKAGVRDGKRRKGLFNIKKVELMHHVPRLVKQLGSVMQYSTDQTEHCHINMAKLPYEATNKRDYADQMCRYLDCREKIRLFTMYQLWLNCDGANGDDILDGLSSYGDENSDVVADPGEDEALQGVGADGDELNWGDDGTDQSPCSEKFGLLAGQILPRPRKDLFQEPESVIPRNETTAFRLTRQITYPGVSVEAASTTYNLPDFHDVLLVFHYGVRSRSTLSYKRVDIWNSVRMQLRAVQSEDCILSPQTVMACPRLGLYNFVLVKEAYNTSCSGIQGNWTLRAQ